MPRMAAFRLTLAGLPLLRRRALLPFALLALLSLSSVAAFAAASPEDRPLRLPEAPTVLAVSPATNRIYVALWPDDVVYALDRSSYRVLGGIQLVGAPAALAVDPSTEHVYAAVPNGVAVIAGSTMTLLTTITMGASPTAIAVDHGAHRIYVATQFVREPRPHGALEVLDSFDDAVVAHLPVGLAPTGVAVDPSDQRIYVANNASNSVSVLDGRTGAALTTIPVGRAPWAVAVDPARRRLYVSNASDSTLMVIDTTREAVIATIPIRGCPGRIVVDAAHRAYVTLDYGGLAVVSADLAAVQATLPLGDGVRDLAVDPGSGMAYATAFDDGALWAIRSRRFGEPRVQLVARVPAAPDEEAAPADTSLD